MLQSHPSPEIDDVINEISRISADILKHQELDFTAQLKAGAARFESERWKRKMLEDRLSHQL